MKFCIISHVIHSKKDGSYFAYAPYVREMNLWISNIDTLIIVAPQNNNEPTAIDKAYKHKKIRFISIPDFNLTTNIELFKTILKLPLLFFQISKGMILADHIHLRCPGNVGLIGCIVQILLPWKKKTAKYAGNWDWKSKQPWSYRLQQKILRNTFLTRNMEVLVYGDWNETKNIKPFFTASYSINDATFIEPRNNFQKISLLFVGSLVKGKNPILSCEVIRLLKNSGYNCTLELYGEGSERSKIEEYIQTHQLQNNILLYGNQPSENLKLAYRRSQFLVFVSKSEGWPKVVTEAMWWGCLPITSSVSCVPEIIGIDQRGDLIEPNAHLVAEKIIYYFNNKEIYTLKANNAINWSRQFNLERFKKEVKNFTKS
jgi:glycosyltransferase involved in cell wall biosynthesis